MSFENCHEDVSYKSSGTTASSLGFSEQVLESNSAPEDCQSPVLKISVDWTKQLHHHTRSLNSEFIGIGLQPFLIFELKDHSTATVQYNLLISSCLALFERQIRTLHALEVAEDSLRRVTGDLDHSRKMNRRLQENLAAASIANSQNRERERRLEAEKTAVNAQLRSAKETIRRLQLDCQHRITQCQHEMKKQEHECTGLRKRLNTLLRAPVAKPAANEVTSVASGRSSQLTSATLSSSSLEAMRRRCRSTNRSSQLCQTTTNRLTNSTLSLVDAGASEADASVRCELDLARNMIAHLERRENELFHENRELRDMVSVLASRMFRFSRFAKKLHVRQRSNTPVCVYYEGDDDADGGNSLDSYSDEEQDAGERREGGSNYDRDKCFPSASSSSSDLSDESELSTRRQSADVHTLLLEMPYPLVRNKLANRVHNLSRRLWRRLKRLYSQDSSTHPPSQTYTQSSTGKLGEPEASCSSNGNNSELESCRQQLAECERKLREKDEILAKALFSNVRRRESLFRLVDQHSPQIALAAQLPAGDGALPAAFKQPPAMRDLTDPSPSLAAAVGDEATTATDNLSERATSCVDNYLQDSHLVAAEDDDDGDDANAFSSSPSSPEYAYSELST
uniref:Afadin-and alpha-actinin-binding protein A n=1 Tax=Schistocephalus solidus TaxID=70667 RepID=A0A0X3NY16_SCHSO